MPIEEENKGNSRDNFSTYYHPRYNHRVAIKYLPGPDSVIGEPRSVVVKSLGFRNLSG